MKIFILLLTVISFVYSKQYVFIVDKYNKEIELEAKIISKIATSSLKGKVNIFIPDINTQEIEVYSNYFNLAKSCETANFVFDKKSSTISGCVDKDNKLFFTNNYKRLIENKKYYGAFFWNKGRPNIVFLKKRFESKNINLPREYNQFIEDIDVE